MKAEQFHVKNQFILTDNDGNQYFQSYNTVIAKRSLDGTITLDRDWNYSKTTSKYRNMFTNMTTDDTLKAINNGTIKITDLNNRG